MTVLEQEIRAQPDVIASRAARGWEAAARAADILRADDVDYLMIAARGSSDNAARYAQYLLGSTARLPVALAAPWLYAGGAPPLLRRAAILVISQSGRSPDVIQVAAAGRDQGRPTIALTNDLASPLAEIVDVVVPMLAGEERSVAATKTYLASLHAIAQISQRLAPRPDDQRWCDELPSLLDALIGEQLATRERFDPLAGAATITVVGRGLQLASAHETALKIRELSAIPAEAFSAADIRHGPIAALGAGGAVWLVSTAGRQQPDRSTLAALSASGARTVVVSDDPALCQGADIAVEIGVGIAAESAVERAVGIAPSYPPWLAPLLATIPGQVAALRLGERRGIPVDTPPGLSKVTMTN